MNIIDVNSIQQNYIVNSKEVEIFVAVLRLLLSIETEEKEEEKENVELFSIISRSLFLEATAIQVVDCLCLLDAQENID